MAKKVALGKGIASLIGNSNDRESDESRNASIMMNANNEMSEKAVERVEVRIQKEIVNTPLLVSVGEIKTNPHQPRKIFKEKDLNELASSIKENGVIQPLIVSASEGGGYELVAGERRLRASKIAGLEFVPVVVKKASDRDRMIMSIIENVQRADLNCVEEALAYFQLMDEYNLTQDEVGRKLGKERSSVANFLRLLKLPRRVIELLQDESLSFGHGKILASIKEREKCISVAIEAAKKGLSVKDTEKLIKVFGRAKTEGEKEDFFSGKLDQYKQKLEQKTGYHFGISANAKGSGQVFIKFNNEAEFNDVYEYLLSR